MSLARGGQNGGHYYSNIVMPQEIDLQFTVDATNGLGVTSIKSNGWVANVFMHTSTTPSTGNEGIVNPNPANGVLLIQMKQNFNAFLGCNFSFRPPVTGGAVTSVTTGTAYVISVLGTTTLAQWQAVGLPPGLTPTLNQSFVAKATQAIGGSGSVKVVTTSAIFMVEVVGDPNQSIANSSIASNGGAWLCLQLLNASSALTAPTASTIVNANLLFDRSSVSVDGL